MAAARPTPIGRDIRFSWVVYEFATRADAEQFLIWTREAEIENRGATTFDDRHYVWSRD